MTDKNETTEEKKERVTVPVLLKSEPLDGVAKKQFTRLQKAAAEFSACLIETEDVPLRHLRVLRRDLNAVYVANIEARKPDKKERIAERIAKLEKQLAEMDD